MLVLGTQQEIKTDMISDHPKLYKSVRVTDNHKVTPESIQLQMLPMGSQEKEQGFMTKKHGLH